MKGPPLGPDGEDITWPNQVAPRGRKASSTRKIKPQTSNLSLDDGGDVPSDEEEEDEQDDDDANKEEGRDDANVVDEVDSDGASDNSLLGP